MEFKVTDELVLQIKELIHSSNNKALLELVGDAHFADIAELVEELSIDDAFFLIKLLDKEKTSDVIAELDEDTREKILERFSSKEIADEISNLDTDDAADIISELPEEQKEEVISYISDTEHAKDIVELLRYDEDTAGGLMAKELVKVNENWNVLTCIKEIREQGQEVTRVHSIYVVNDDGALIGRLSLKDLITSSTKTAIKDIYISNVDYVNVNDDVEEVARKMQKYDLEAIPVVDELKILVGRITIDDVVDVIKEEAEKDYQMAAGITQDVEADDSVWDITKARLPWLFLGLFGGIGAARIMGFFEGALENNAVLFMFTPLIAAMAGNVGVQSSAIIVQGLANDEVKGSISGRLLKEMLLAMLNGFILSVVLFTFTAFWKDNMSVAIAVSVSLFTVIIVAGLVGTFIPLFLHKKGIDPAMATGPFITTSNDIFGILIYFYIAKLILGF